MILLHCLNLAHNIHTVQDLAENDVFAVQMRSSCC
jgi:hypothetical protein